MAFHQQLIKYLKRYHIHLDLKTDIDIMKSIEDAFHREGRKRLSAFFIYRTVRSLKKRHNGTTAASIETLTNLMAQLEKASRKRAPKNWLFNMFTREGEASYKVLRSDDTPLSPQKINRLLQCTSGARLSFSPAKGPDLNAAHTPRPRIHGANGVYEKEATVGPLSFWRKLTPKKEGALFTPHRQRFSQDVEQALPQEPSSVQSAVRVEHFSFDVTAETLREREHQPRPVSQKQVVGCSARDLFLQHGAVLDAFADGRHFHLGHRQGFALGGPQSRENLDAITAASNYDTLFKVESIIYDLLNRRGCDKVEVRGEVHFDHLHSDVPYKIVYQIAAPGIPSREVVIDPRSHRLPRQSEVKLLAEAPSLVKRLFND